MSMMTPQHSLPDPAVLTEHFEARRGTVAVIGLGYVGLPLLLAFGQAGFDVIGYDIAPEKAERLMRGDCYIQHIDSAPLRPLLESGRLKATARMADLAGADVAIICVPTPLTAQREPDLSYIEKTTAALEPYLKPGQLVVLESTTWPGTTMEVMRPILERGGLVAGRDFFLAYSPEREDPGNARYSTRTIPKVVGGDGEAATAMAAALYRQAIGDVVPVSSTQVAEAVKLTENIFRSVNIALVNELKVVYSRMGIDVWEVINAAKTKPFGYMPFYPGPGLGGHCIPIDPFYLTWKAREFNVNTRFIELAGEINSQMPGYVVGVLQNALNDHAGVALRGSRVLLLGMAYKKNVDDVRESPAFALLSLMEERGAVVDYHDPHVPEIPPTREHAQYSGRRSIALTAEALAGYTAVLICTDHDTVDYGLLESYPGLIVDTRNVMAGRRTRGTIVAA
ncbi:MULTISPECIES: nucleotide sugar dehydrogenase [unclassified Azospirillum]|uniref:nucleotide sugar dehydrogenase n=1 Tax=unclassified Azospirillum TaxID=2630922 RepID=UPI000D65E814|nr:MULTISPECIES: nucleotide sugar dehydrogenase [unclassified Azospirillum]